MTISAQAHLKKTILVDGQKMAYVEMGAPSQDPIVFLHGNPTSSYLWRNIQPLLKDKGWCLAPDLIGMGSSDKLPNHSYRFIDHRHYLDGWFEALGLTKRTNITLVIHDWGSALGFDWARRHPTCVKAIAYMEAIVCPFDDWEEWPENARGIFQGFRSPNGEDMVLDKNIFVETVLPSSILRQLSDEEMSHYRAPFANAGEDRRPTLTWPREIPIEGEPSDVAKIVKDYAKWMSANEIAKLFINAEPGAILTGTARDFCRSWKNQREVSVKGSHFIQEDSPQDIASAIKQWLG